MKKTSFVLVAFALVAMLFTGCSITSYLNDTTWVNSTTEDGVVMTYTLKFVKGGTGSYSQAASLTAEAQAEYEALGYTEAQITE
ncbi:MAG: hypothetical protein K6G52_00940 [Treponemataceae bacterium]|nr:hypothetical protein [Treponemataceae bacterium]